MWLLYGFGISMRAVAKYFASIGEEFVIHDDSPTQLDMAKSYGYLTSANHTIVDRNGNSLCGNGGISLEVSAAITSPGTNKLHGIKIPLYNDIGLFFHFYQPPYVIAITGSFGKSSTTSLIEHIYTKNIEKMQVGGNIGVPIFECDPSAPIALELSSYQLEIVAPPVDIGVLLNVYPQHLDRHVTMENYIQAKRNIFRNAKIRIINFDLCHDENYKTISTNNPEADYCIINNKIYENGKETVSIDMPNIADISIIGAYAVCRELHMAPSAIVLSMTNFKPLQHRCEIVYKTDSQVIVNDSKSTNLLNSLYCLNRFKSNGSLAWIAGGQLIDQDLSILDNLQLDLVCTIGESGAILANHLKSKNINVVECENLEVAVLRSMPYSTIIFSPGYRSFDLYQNFEERGNHFKSIVAKLYSTACN